MASSVWENLYVFWGWGACREQGPQGLVLQCGGHIETLSKGDLKQVPRLGRDLGSHTCVHGWDAVDLLTKNLEAENKYTGGMGGPNAAHLLSRRQLGVVNSG